ncbi:MAG: prephenate dehydratase [Eubacteriales bacterium]|nr:prephenate dehydratase [Eubacteriales bacterium]
MGYTEEIGDLRQRINEIDEKLVNLFSDRMEAAERIADLKKQYGKDVFDRQREDIVMAHALESLKNQNYRSETMGFFRALMDLSKKYQQKAIQPKEAETLSFAQKPGISVGYLGIPGSFSHTAATETFGNKKLKSYDTFENIFDGMKNGEIDYAILPAENTETGSITSVVDLLAKYGYYIVAEKLLKVSQSLLGVKGAALDDIKKVYSHPEPLLQCRAFLAAHPGIETYPSLSTAQAAKMAADTGDKRVACIASEKAAAIYGLDVLETNIQNNDNNCTRFVIIAKQPYRDASCDKTSIVLMLEHKPGSLCDMLRVFSGGGINVLKLESRPLKDRPFEYLFHLDFEGSIYDPGIAKTIEIVRQKAAGYTYLGCYPKEKLTV